MKTIDDAQRTKTRLDGSERFFGRDADGDFKITSEHMRGAISDGVPIGTIIMFGSATAPSNYITCNGDAISRTEYASLFAVIGTTYGAGNGTTTFNLPDYRALSPKGTGNQSVNGRTKTGPASVGKVQEDQGQGHWHSDSGSGVPTSPKKIAANITSGTAQVYLMQDSGGVSFTGGYASDGTNGTPRMGAYTRDSTLGTHFCIKYQ